MARPKGTINKTKERLWKALEAEWGEKFHPIVEMTKNAIFLQGIANRWQDVYHEQPGTLPDEAVEASEKANAQWKEVAPYLAAKYQAIEFSQDPESPITGITVEFVKANNDEPSPEDT